MAQYGQTQERGPSRSLLSTSRLPCQEPKMELEKGSGEIILIGALQNCNHIEPKKHGRLLIKILLTRAYLSCHATPLKTWPDLTSPIVLEFDTFNLKLNTSITLKCLCYPVFLILSIPKFGN